jgi:hypothetical protein
MMKNIFNKITSYTHNLLFYKKIFSYLLGKNISTKESIYFLHLLDSINKIKTFYDLIIQPVSFNTTHNNIFTQIPGFTHDELEYIFVSMKDSTKGNVSLGPGELFLIIFFQNISQNKDKGDLNIKEIGEVELKSRTGNHGSLFVSKYYTRGSFSISVKPHISTLINNLKLSTEHVYKLETFNVSGKRSWLIKINNIYKLYFEYNGDKNLFIQEFNNILKTMYPTFGINISPFVTDTFNYEAFNLYLTQLSSTEYIKTSSFKGIIFANHMGHFKFFKNEDFVEAINKQEIKISYPSDLFSRLKI